MLIYMIKWTSEGSTWLPEFVWVSGPLEVDII